MTVVLLATQAKCGWEHWPCAWERAAHHPDRRRSRSAATRSRSAPDPDRPKFHPFPIQIGAHPDRSAVDPDQRPRSRSAAAVRRSSKGCERNVAHISHAGAPHGRPSLSHAVPVARELVCSIKMMC